MKLLMENWRKYLNERDGTLIGYKIVAYEGGKLYSLQNPDLEYNVKVGTVESPANGMFLGTTEDFVKDYYLEMTDKQDALLTYEYNAEDVISGNLDEDGEVKVTQAVLKDIEVLPTEEGRDWQRESERITGHEQNKETIIGDGGQENSAPYEKKPIKKRSKGAPPAG